LNVLTAAGGAAEKNKGFNKSVGVCTPTDLLKPHALAGHKCAAFGDLGELTSPL